MRIIIAVIGVIGLALLSVLFYQKFYIPYLSDKPAKKEVSHKTAKQKLQKVQSGHTFVHSLDGTTAQEAIGLSDIVGPHNILEDGSIVSLVEVKCKNASLNTVEEDVREARRAARVFAGTRGAFSIIYQQRLVDNSEDLLDLQNHYDKVQKSLREITQLELSPKSKDNMDFILNEKRSLLKRREILSDKIHVAKEFDPAASEQYQTRTVLCIKTPAGQDSQRKAIDRAQQIIRLLDENGFESYLLNDLGCIDVNRSYFYESPAPEENIDPSKQISIPFYLTKELNSNQLGV